MLEIHFRFCTALHDINPFVEFLFFLMQELWKWGSSGLACPHGQIWNSCFYFFAGAELA